jgi:hypothetical protein
MSPADVNVAAVAAADSRRSNSPESDTAGRRPQKKRAKRSSTKKYYTQSFLKRHAPAVSLIADKARDRIRHFMFTDKAYAFPESSNTSYTQSEARYAEAVENFPNFTAESQSIVDEKEIDQTFIIGYVRLSLHESLSYLHCAYWIIGRSNLNLRCSKVKSKGTWL